MVEHSRLPIATARAPRMRREPTDAERKLWYLLRDRRLVGIKFRRQVPLGPYIADFVCYGRRLVVEADGGQHAECAHDRIRDDWLRAEGFLVVRYWNVDILTNPEGVVADLASRLGLEWS